MPTKYSYEEVQKYIKSRGFTLLTEFYTNSLQELKISCPIHGVQFVTLKWLKRGTGCFKCGQKIKGDKLKIPFKKVKEEIEKAGYVLLSTEYKSSDLLLKMECSKHGEFSTSYYAIKSGHGCKVCGHESVGNKKRTPFEEIIKIVARTSYILVSNNRTSHAQKLKLKCKIHGEFELSLWNLKSGQGCIKCGNDRGGKKNRLSHEEFCKRISHFGYKILTTYRTSHDYITVKCLKHGEFNSISYSLLQGHGCPKCANCESEAEKELFEKMKSYFPTAKKHRSKVHIKNKSFIKRFEIDIFITELSKGIEFDGKYYHSFERMRKDKSKRLWSDDDIHNYHKIKDDWFASKGIRILHIKEEDWIKNKQACIDKCLAFLSNSQS